MESWMMEGERLGADSGLMGRGEVWEWTVGLWKFGIGWGVGVIIARKRLGSGQLIVSL